MNVQTLQIPVEQVAAGADGDGTCIVPPGKWRIIKAYFCPSVAAAANATHYATLTLSTNQAAAGSFTACATAITTATVAMALATPRELVLLTTAAGAAACQIADGGSIKIAKTYASNGVAIGGIAMVTIEKVP